MAAQLQTPSFAAAVALCNRAFAEDSERFCALLARVLQGVGAAPVGEEEQASLRVALALDSAELTSLLDGCALAFRTAAASGAGAQALGDQIAAAGGGDETAAAFRDTWKQHSPALLATLRQAEWGSTPGLRGCDWRVVVPVAGEGVAEGAPPQQRAVLELHVGAADGMPRTVAFELSHEQLGSLFGTLERIQEQIDALG